MKRNDYEKPMTKVVKLQHQSHILAGSGEQPQGNGGSMPQGVEAEEF